jgi:hypothetical protein
MRVSTTTGASSSQATPGPPWPWSCPPWSWRLWRFNWRRPGRAALVTADTGQAVFFQTQYDLVVADGKVHWAAADLVANMPVTQIRSVPLTGGKVAVREERGTFVLSAWPWLVTPFSGRAEPARLINLATGEKVTVGHTPGELARCSPAWCRVGITGEAGLVRTDLKRPDGSQRRRMAGGDAAPALNDVALLDRFEVLVSTVAGDRLELFDITAGRTVVIDSGLFTVLDTAACSGGRPGRRTLSPGTRSTSRA